MVGAKKTASGMRETLAAFIRLSTFFMRATMLLSSASSRPALTDEGRRCSHSSRDKSACRGLLIVRSRPGSVARACISFHAACAVVSSRDNCDRLKRR